MIQDELYVQPTESTILGIRIFDECEWCFKFDDDEPVVIAATESSTPIDKKNLEILITNQSNSNIVFYKGGKRFEIFAREKNIQNEQTSI